MAPPVKPEGQRISCAISPQNFPLPLREMEGPAGASPWEGEEPAAVVMDL